MSDRLQEILDALPPDERSRQVSRMETMAADRKQMHLESRLVGYVIVVLYAIVGVAVLLGMLALGLWVLGVWP